MGAELGALIHKPSVRSFDYNHFTKCEVQNDESRAQAIRGEQG